METIKSVMTIEGKIKKNLKMVLDKSDDEYDTLLELKNVNYICKT